MASATPPGERRDRPVVRVVGLGPAGPELTTPAAAAALADAPLVLLRTARHPAAAPFVAAGARALDEHYEKATTFEETYAAIVEDVVATAASCGQVAYAVPGSPLVLEQTVRALLADERVEVDVVAGMSFLDLAWARLRLDPVEARARLVDGERFALDAAGDTGPLLVSQVWSLAVLSEVKLAVDTFPSEPVVVLHHLGLADEQVVELAWEDLDRGTVVPDHLTCLWIPRLAEPVAAELVRLDGLVRVLRERCPWDREQTHASLARHLLEEAYEAVDAIAELDGAATPAAVDHLEEELGDVLCQVYYHALLAEEEGQFTLADVARTVHDKLVHRHPHVFGGLEAADAGEVVSRWERAKQEEKGRESLTEGIPAALPSLALAAKLERKLRSAGLGLAATGTGPGEPEALLGRFLGEVATAATARSATGTPAGAAEALGSLLLVLARTAADAGIDPEDALGRAARGLAGRIRGAEAHTRARGVTLLEAAEDDRLAAWDAAGAD